MKAIIKKDKAVIEHIGFDPIPGMVQVRVIMVALCRTDLYVAAGTVPAGRDNLILGHEACVQVINAPDKTMIGKLASVNPLYPGKKFLGLDIDGLLCEYANIPPEQLIVCETDLTAQTIAYLEPIAASYAIDRAHLEGNGIVIGDNRIAELTRIIASTMGLSMHPAESYDWIIETQMSQENLDFMVSVIKDGGKIVIKSRNHNPMQIVANQLIKKDITLQAVSYADFHKTMRWLEVHADKIDNLIGRTYSFEDFEAAFAAAMTSESKKIFIKVSEICADSLRASKI